MPDYISVDEAAHAALQHIEQFEDSSKTEYVSLIYQDPESGKYLFTTPSGNGSKSKSRATFSVPKGSARGIVHNHPTGGRSKNLDNLSRFSPQDVQMAKQLNLPSYIGLNGKLLRWHPETGKMRRNMGIGEEVSKSPTEVSQAFAAANEQPETLTDLFSKGIK